MNTSITTIDNSVKSPVQSRKGIGGKIVLISFIVAFALAPQVIGHYYITLLIPFFAYAITLLGFNLLFGYGGLLSFGHALFVAVGAYAAATLALNTGMVSFELMLCAAVGAALIIATPIAILASRYTGIFFGMLTLAFGMLFYTFLNKFYDITGGDGGLMLPRPTLLGVNFESANNFEFLAGPFYYYCLVLVLLLGWIMWRVVHSPYGLHLMASRDNAVKATYLGVKVREVRAIAFIVSALYGAIGGVILGVNTGLADPELAYWVNSGYLVFMTVLGGYHEFIGPVIGALVFILLQDELSTVTQHWRFFLGVVLAVLVIALPGGISGGFRSAIHRVRTKGAR